MILSNAINTKKTPGIISLNELHQTLRQHLGVVVLDHRLFEWPRGHRQGALVILAPRPRGTTAFDPWRARAPVGNTTRGRGRRRRDRENT